ncbi:MAG: hypothetical protein AB7T06_09625 [Kofleriaceae bacterium]
MAIMPSHPNKLIEIENLITVTGGAGRPGTAQTNQAELREMAQQYCPATYQRYRNAPQITRPMAEKCLDEAGYGWARGRLDRYFPPTR